MNRVSENIIVVPRRALFPNGAFVGFISDVRDEMWDKMAEGYRLVERNGAETDPSLKQIIPYVVLHGDRGYFLYRRLPAGGENRLEGKYSIGLGGHISESDLEKDKDKLPLIWQDPKPDWVDSKLGSIVANGLIRELLEEVNPDTGKFPVRFLGAINDEVVPVARVHFGLVFQVELGDAGARVSAAESNQLAGQFVSAGRVMDHWNRLEGWSQILSRAIF